MQLKDQAAIVTGGASGLGAATARKLAAQGARVAVCDLNAKLAESVAAEINGVAVTCDVSDAASAEASVAAAAKAHGPARVLVNCAGIGVAKRVVGRDGPHPLGDFEKVIKINLIGTFNMLRLATSAMSKLERLKLSIRLSIVIQSPWVEGMWNFARVSTMGMPTRPYFLTMACLEKPAASNMIEVESSNISK